MRESRVNSRFYKYGIEKLEDRFYRLFLYRSDNNIYFFKCIALLYTY